MSEFKQYQLYKILIGGIGTKRIGDEDIEFDTHPELVGQVMLVETVWNEQGLCLGVIVQGNNVGERICRWFTEKQLEYFGSVKVEDDDSNL